MHIGSHNQHIQTVHPCINTRFSSVINEEEIECFRQKQGLADGCILYLGILEPRKNITTITQAYVQLYQIHAIQDASQKDTRTSSHRIVSIVGAPLAGSLEYRLNSEQ